MLLKETSCTHHPHRNSETAPWVWFYLHRKFRHEIYQDTYPVKKSIEQPSSSLSLSYNIVFSMPYNFHLLAPKYPPSYFLEIHFWDFFMVRENTKECLIIIIMHLIMVLCVASTAEETYFKKNLPIMLSGVGLPALCSAPPFAAALT